MPKIFGELQEATLENLSSDPAANTQGRIWYNDTSERIMLDDGTNKRALLRNDQKLILGNSGTESENIRLHRGGAGVLQLLAGDDTTAEGSLATSNFQQLSFRLEGYPDASKPAVGNVGRVIYNTDTETFEVDTGAVWNPADSVSDGSITTVKLDDEAVTTAKLGPGAVTREKMSQGAVADMAVTSVTADIAPYSALETDDLILVDAISEDITINLPAAASNSGKRLKIKRTDNHAINLGTFVDGDVNPGTDTINIPSHTFTDLEKVRLTTTGGLPTGLSILTDYWVIYVDSNNIQFASSLSNAIADTPVDITAAVGGGTHTVTSESRSVTIDGSGSETIDGDLFQLLTARNETLSLICDGSSWQILNRGGAVNRYQVRSLPSTIGSDSTDISTLRLSNLIIGKTYELFMYGQISGGSQSTGTLTAVHNGSNILRVIEKDPGGASSDIVGSSSRLIFVAAASTVTFDFNESSNNTLVGSGNTTATFVSIEELNGGIPVEVTDFSS